MSEELEALDELYRALEGVPRWKHALLAAAREAEELRAWQREAAAELRAVNQGFTANRALVRALLARVKP